VVGSTLETEGIFDSDDFGVVPGSEGVVPEAPTTLQQDTELQVTVALDARIRGPATGVSCDVWGDDGRLESVREVEDVVIDPDLFGDPASVLDVCNGATSAVGNPSPELESHAGDVVSLLDQQSGSDR
jgi:hypothetical protein